MSLTEEIHTLIDEADASFGQDNYDAWRDKLLEASKLLKDGEMPESALLIKLTGGLREYATYFDNVMGDDDSEDQYDEPQRILDLAKNAFPDSLGLTVEQGRLFYEQREDDKAIGLFDSVIGSSQNAEEEKLAAYRWKAAAFRGKHSLDEAEHVLSTAEAQVGLDIGFKIERAWLDFDRKRYDAASAKFKNILDAIPSTEDAIVGQIASAQALDDETNLEQLARSLLNCYSPCRQVRLLAECASIQWESENYQAQLAASNLLIKLCGSKANARAWEIKLDALVWIGQYAEAEPVYQAAIAEFPMNSGIVNEFGFLLYWQARYCEALEVFDRSEVKKTAFAIEFGAACLRLMYKLKEAEARVDNGLKDFAERPGLLYEKSYIQRLNRKYAEAEAGFRRILAIDSSDEDANQSLVAVFRRQKRYKDAEDTLVEAIQRMPDSPELWSERGWINFDQGQLSQAESSFAKAAELNCHRYDFELNRLQVLIRMNRLSEARALLDSLEIAFPQAVDIKEQQGWFYLRRGNLEKSEKCFKGIDASRTHNTDGAGSQKGIKISNVAIAIAANGLGRIHLERGEYKAARDEFEKAIQAVDYEPSYRVNLAWMLVKQAADETPVGTPGVAGQKDAREEMLKEAEKKCEDALRLNPSATSAHVCLGTIAFMRERSVEAEDWFRSSIECDPKDGSFVDLGHLYTLTGRFDEAEIHLKKAMLMNPSDARAHVEMANLMSARGHIRDTVLECRQAVALAPHSEDTHRALGAALMRAGEYSEAERAMRIALGGVNGIRRWRLYLMLARCLIQVGDARGKQKSIYEEALTQVNLAKQYLNGKNAEVHFNAGIVQYKLERYREAKKSLRGCIEINPDHHEARRILDTIKSNAAESRASNGMRSLGPLVLGIFVLSVLVISWFKYLFLNSEDIGKLLPILTPVLLAFLIVAFLLPSLIKLKLPGGFEAEIESQSKESISAGPKGELVIVAPNISEGEVRAPDRA